MTGNQVTTLKGHASTVVCLAWTTDGKILISGSTDRSVRTWNTETWEQITVLKPVQFTHTSSLWAIAISPNGCILASASSDCTTRLWNLNNGQPISPPLKHANTVTCMSFSADGKQLATGCYDYDAYTWDVSAIVGENYNNNNLLLDLTTDATRRPVQRPDSEETSHRRIPPGFFDPLPNADGHRIQQAEEVRPRPLVDFFDHSRDRVRVRALQYGPAIEAPVSLDGHTTSAPPSFMRHFSSLFHRSQPDPDVTLNLSPRPWLGFFSRRAPSPRTVGQRTSRRYVAPVPNIRRTSQGQRRRDQNQGGTLLLPTSHSQPAGATTSALAPPPPSPRPRPLSVTNPAVTPSAQQIGYWTLFLRRICCFDCCCICRGSSESSDDRP
ncbi:WD40-repeat-containing domain protein [Suillus clintonianus]|uniref:WD40-repeat-containing domain protein n=1 Tax=Suillus clintonianus TaxID=1904413 RepID=UPI001B884463|nr:WD40-repeat-containing domain protein [Suillus clintonianus]KAG2132108.1 WD40-repeat-containing domain protein [Suillus clintonianus]